MTRLAVITIVTLCMMSPALAEEVLFCTDTDVNGFAWDEQGKASRSGFNPGNFTVKVISATTRMIRWEKWSRADPYLCRKGRKGRLSCDAAVAERQLVLPIVFGTKGYTRAFLLGTPLGGKTASRIMVAYGTCTKS